MRIVAGAAKGRRLAVPANATRPTSDRAREGMFSTVAGLLDLDGVRVLDLYAGTGAVGLEALSRGAREAVFVESDRNAATVLRRNVETVALPGATIVPRTVTAYLSEQREAFDLVFADPPYDLDDGQLSAVLEVVALNPDAIVVVERSARGPDLVWPDSITPVRERRYGAGVLWYGRRR